MKFIRNHLAFIFPMMAILLGVEFFLVFDRTTDSYEKGLKEGYSMFVVTKKPFKLEDFKSLNRHISDIVEIDKDRLAKQISDGMSQSNGREILKALPYFYDLKLDGYLKSSALDGIKEDLLSNKDIKKVETFGNSYSESYRLFAFIKLILNVFIVFMALISMFLIIKQMEIWRYAHKERMQIMKVFGAPLMLRSGVLFRVALIDAIISSFLTSGAFLTLKYKLASDKHIEILTQKQNLLFQSTDFLILIGTSILIVLVAVSFVVFDNEE
ncbi:Cell division protein FtsX [hydrothermal vent metagenome]|uniref:Cell division protein FtsX n=1 Tax=hydrothermal vent metagenome TaxID=652676 RepID=A0A1W1CEZ2_9ZZZZ